MNSMLGAVGGDGGEVCGGGDANSGFPAVGYDPAPALGGHLANASRFGETTHATNVGLGDVDLANVRSSRQILKAGVLPLPGGITGMGASWCRRA